MDAQTKEKLEGDPGSSCKHLEGWDTFWAPCRDGRKGKSGFNGVATLARKGLTMRADRAPLREEDLDAEGRCLMTDHGDFCLFNVYAPSGGATTPAPWWNTLSCQRGGCRDRVQCAGNRRTTLHILW